MELGAVVIVGADEMVGAADGAISRIKSPIAMSLVQEVPIANTANGAVRNTFHSTESNLENAVPIAIRASRIPVIR